MERVDRDFTEYKKDAFEPAERGYIYEFLEKDGSSKNEILVVSSDSRRMDRIISLIMVGDSPKGYDVVPVKYNGKKRYLHCGCVTYAARERLGKKICKVADSVMDYVTITLANELGIENQGVVYKKMYDEIIDKIISNQSVSLNQITNTKKEESWLFNIDDSDDRYSDTYRIVGTEEQAKEYLWKYLQDFKERLGTSDSLKFITKSVDDLEECEGDSWIGRIILDNRDIAVSIVPEVEGQDVIYL